VRAALRRRRKKDGKKVKIWMFLVFMIVFLSAGSLWYSFRTRAKQMEIKDKDNGSPIVTVTGITEIGTVPVIFAIDFLEDTRLCVEEVYLSSGDTVTAGEAYMKFTDDSIEKARAELEKAVQNTELAYRSRMLSIEEDKIHVKYTYDTAALEAEFAPQVYQDTLTQLEMQLVKAQKAYEEAQEEYNAYYLAVENNTFYEDYQVETLKKAYEDAYDLFASRRAYWEVTQEELDTLSDKNKNARNEQSDRQWIIQTVALLKEEMTEAQAEYEQARQDYQREIEGAELKLQKLLNQLERAQQSVTDAQLECQKGSFRARTSYELAVAKGQTAQKDYDACLINFTHELERLKDARDDALEKKAFFEELVGDGYFYTDQAGIIFMTDVEKGQTLAGGEQILTYEKPEERFVSVIVPAADAAKFFVEGKVNVEIADCGSFDGIIEAVCPITTSDNETCIDKIPISKAAVHDMVIVSVIGDVSVIEPDLTAVVVFSEDAQDDIVQCNAVGRKAAARGMASPMYDLDILAETDEAYADYLEIAKIYVEEGQHIKEGDLVCQFTQNSMEKVRKALIANQSKACAALMEAQASYQIGVLEAALSHNEAMIDKMLAQTVYDNTIAKLNSNMVSKILETQQLLADIYQMQLSLTDDSHQRQRADITRAYDQAKQQMENTKERFVTNQVKAAQTFQEAKNSYEDFFSQMEISNQQITDKVEEVYALQEEILQNQQLMEKELLAAEQTRSSAQTEGEIANAKYAGILKEYDNIVQRAQSDLEQAAQKLDDFNQFVGDGTLYATGNGVIVKVGYKKGDLLDDVQKLVSIVADTDSLIEENQKEDLQ